MKKWLSHTWKYYFGCTILIFIFLLLSNYYIRDLLFHDYQLLDPDSIYWNVQDSMAGMNYIYVGASNILVIGCVVMKLLRFWVEKDSWGRSFFASLPVKRHEQKRSQIVADFVVVVVAYGLLTLTLYIVAHKLFHTFDFKPDWFGASLIGEMITSIAYTWMLIGLLHLVEAVFVNGIGKVVGIIFTYGWIELSELGIRGVFSWTKGLQTIYGFLLCELPGKQHYELYNAPDSISLYDGGWVAEAVPVTKIYNDIKPDFIPEQYWKQEMVWDAGARFYHYSDMSSYLGYAIAYLLIGILLCVIATKLVEKQDLSKKLFYFKQVKYVYAALIGSAFWFMMMMHVDSVAHLITICVSTILLVVFVIYLCAKAENGFVVSSKIKSKAS